MNNKVLIIFAAIVICVSVSGAFFYNLTRASNQKVQGGLLPTPGENQISVSVSTVTVTTTISETVASSFGGNGGNSTSTPLILTSTSQQQPYEVFTTSSCNYSQNSSQCETVTANEYSVNLQNANGADCTYGNGLSYKINGTVLAYWEIFQSSDNTVSQYVNLYLEHFSVFYQNGTIYGSGFQPNAPMIFTGDLPYNITKFSILSNNNMVLDTSTINLDYNPCFPTSLVLSPVVA